MVVKNMENCIISDFQRLHVLTSGEVCSRRRIDDLVPDLIQALEESSSSSHYKHHRKRGFKRRAKYIPSINIPKLDASDDLDSSQGENAVSNEKVMDTLHQSDSDEMSPTSNHQKSSCSLFKFPASLQESDSFNETFSPVRPHTRRKNRFKRMTVDSAVHSLINLPLSSKSNCKLIRKENDHKLRFTRPGKRKRSFRDNSVDFGGFKDLYMKDKGYDNHPSCQKMESDDMIDASSCSSLSSNESDNGFMTTDEGREADDEQSDWFHEPGPSYGVPCIPGANRWKEEDSDESINRSLVPGKNKKMLKAGVHPCKGLKGGIDLNGDREILSGRRQLKEGPISAETPRPLGEEVDRFLQDPTRVELKLGRINPDDREGLLQLCSLYSLKVYDSGVNGDTFLVKSRSCGQPPDTGTTASAQNQLCSLFTGSIKRRRKLPPCLAHPAEGSIVQVTEDLTTCP